MIHAIFDRPNASYKVFDYSGEVVRDEHGPFEFEAGGDAWGAPGYGHDGWCPPGHYLLTSIEDNGPNCASEGAYQIDVSDIDDTRLQQLIEAGKAEMAGSSVSIGGIVAKIGQLAAYLRAAIMNHGGGSNAPDPQAPMQQLCKTEGCTRLHNADLARLVTYLRAQMQTNIVVYTIIGDPVILPC